MSKTEQAGPVTVVSDTEEKPQETESVQKEPDSDSSEETLADEEVPEVEVPGDTPDVVPDVPQVRVKRKYTKRASKPSIPTSDRMLKVS